MRDDCELFVPADKSTGRVLTMEDMRIAVEKLREVPRLEGNYYGLMHNKFWLLWRFQSRRMIGSRVCRAKRMAHDR